MTTQTHCLTCGGSKRLPNPSWWRSKKLDLVRPCPNCTDKTIARPSPSVLALAAIWAAGSPMLVSQVGALSRWVAATCEELPKGERADAIATALGLDYGVALRICTVAGALP